MVWEGLVWWERIGVYGFLVVALFLFVVLSKVRIGNVMVIPFWYRVVIAVLFPLIFVVFLLLGAALLGFVVSVVIALFVLSLIQRKIKRRSGV